MNIRDIVATADKAYAPEGDEPVLQAFDEYEEHLRRRQADLFAPHVGFSSSVLDGLAEFVAVELRETYDPNASTP